MLKDLNHRRESLTAHQSLVHTGLSFPPVSGPALQCHLAHLAWRHLCRSPGPFTGLSSPSEELLGEQETRPPPWTQVSGRKWPL